VLQRVVIHENCAKNQRSYSRFRDNNHKERDKSSVNYLEEDTPKDKLICCSFLRHNVDKKDEIKYTFDVSKCDKLFDVLVKGGDKIDGGSRDTQC
jgi:hypothetical protein